ncbi:TetR family transcriptional regulator [Pseudonocardiaceae bacterium YIM PH 21723]|nr:TetR family transcriptional regulator [Pseudonocardiaceae bacterium YIM PH 21723]
MPRGSRRELLSDAAIEVLAREGGRGLTHRAVDREAEVPEGTTKNYFPTRQALLEAVGKRMADEHRDAVARLHELAPESVSVAELVQLYRAMLERARGGGRSQFLALFELYVESVRRPELQRTVGQMAMTNVESALGLRKAAGLDGQVRDAALLDAFFLGLAISMLALPDDMLDTVGFTDTERLSQSLLRAVRVDAEPVQCALWEDDFISVG